METKQIAPELTEMAPPEDESPRWSPGSGLVLLERYALLGLAIALFVFFSLWSQTGTSFFTSANIKVLLANQAVVALLAMAALVPLIGNQFDVSVGAVMGACYWMAANALEAGWSLVAAICVALLIGALVGSINGFVVARIGANSFVATLATWTVVTGLVQLIANNNIITNAIPTSLTDFGAQTFLGVPKVVWLVAAVAIVAWYALNRTVAGRYLHLVGANAQAARLVGLRVEGLVFASFVVSGVLAAVAGIVLLARTGSADPNLGPGYTIPALTACFLGATAIRPGFFNVWGTLVGIFLIGVSVNGLVLAGAEGWVEPVFNGSALFLALMISTLIAKRRGEIRAL